MLEKFRSGKDPALTLPITAPPNNPRLSHRAAAVADEMDRLEDELDRAKAWGQEEHNARLVAESLLAEERKEKTYLLNTNDKLLRRSSQLVALINAAGDLIERCKTIKDLPANANEEPHHGQAQASQGPGQGQGQGQEEEHC